MSLKEVMNDVRTEFKQYRRPLYSSPPARYPRIGNVRGGFELQVEARNGATFENLVDAVDTLVKYAANDKALSGVSSSLQAEIPQLYFDVDRDRAQFPRNSPSRYILHDESVHGFGMSMTSTCSTGFTRYICKRKPPRMQKRTSTCSSLKTSKGNMVPLTALGKAENTTGPGSIKRFNMFTTAIINGEAAPGHSSGGAMKAIEKLAREHLPDNIGTEWSGLSFQEKKGRTNRDGDVARLHLRVPLPCRLVRELVRADCRVVILADCRSLGAYLGVWVFGLENDVYFQIGLVTLIGLAAKNAILIVEFAKVEVDKGVDAVHAAITAARARFRPILMTSLAFVLGMLPMVLATGPGSASRHSIGTGIFFGMIVAISVGIVLVPFFFVQIYKVKMWRKNSL